MVSTLATITPSSPPGTRSEFRSSAHQACGPLYATSERAQGHPA
jgi:hypothetical protein